MIYSKKVCQECKKILTFMHNHMGLSFFSTFTPTLTSHSEKVQKKKKKKGTPTKRDPMLNSRGGSMRVLTVISLSVKKIFSW
jgi:hypothetical protein